MRKMREYLVCVDAGTKSLTVGKIYIAEGDKQDSPIKSDGKREYYHVTNDGGVGASLFGRRFNVLKVVTI